MYHQWSLSQYITYLLLTLVVLSSWTDINGIYAELPQIILTQPERWKLGANLALITNLGNIAPLALVLIKCLYRKRTINPVPINYIIIFIGMLSCFALIFFWSYTTIIGNEKRSTALLILAFFLSLLDCTSSISFADYIQRFRKEFTIYWPLYTDGDIETVATQCAQKSTINYDQITACTHSRLGNQLQHAYATQTENLQPPHQYVPWITLNGEHTDDMQKQAEKDLIGLICKSYKGSDPPAQCTKNL